MRYKTYSIVEGAFDASVDSSTIDAAIESAQKIAKELESEAIGVEGNALTWEIFILPHYCDPKELEEDDVECDCAQWLQAHGPLYTNRATA